MCIGRAANPVAIKSLTSIISFCLFQLLIQNNIMTVPSGIINQYCIFRGQHTSLTQPWQVVICKIDNFHASKTAICWPTSRTESDFSPVMSAISPGPVYVSKISPSEWIIRPEKFQWSSPARRERSKWSPAPAGAGNGALPKALVWKSSMRQWAGRNL